MDYKEKYEMALEGIQEILGSGEDSIKMSRLQLRLQGIFPELKESEDERIRNIIKQSLKSYFEGKLSIGTNDVDYAICLAWLERQGEQKKFIDDLSQQEAMDIAVAKCFDEQKSTEVRTTGYWNVQEVEHNTADKVEPKSAWSEKDSVMLNDVINLIEQGGYVKSISEHYIPWLKSIKERYTWKPSDEQMKALNDINLTGGISYAGQGQELINLYNDLKRLLK